MRSNILRWLLTLTGLVFGSVVLWLLNAGTASAATGSGQHVAHRSATSAVPVLREGLAGHGTSVARAPGVARTVGSLLGTLQKTVVHEAPRSSAAAPTSLLSSVDSTVDGVSGLVTGTVSTVTSTVTDTADVVVSGVTKPVLSTVGSTVRGITGALDTTVQAVTGGGDQASAGSTTPRQQSAAVRTVVPAATKAVTHADPVSVSYPMTVAAAAPSASATGGKQDTFSPLTPTAPATPVPNGPVGATTGSTASTTNSAGGAPNGVLSGWARTSLLGQSWRGPPRHLLGASWCDYYGANHPS